MESIYSTLPYGAMTHIKVTCLTIVQGNYTKQSLQLQFCYFPDQLVNLYDFFTVGKFNVCQHFLIKTNKSITKEI